MSRRLAASAVAASLAAGCVTVHRPRIDDADAARLVPEVAPGVASRQDLLLAYGPASASLEDERVLTWRMMRVGDRELPVMADVDPGRPAYAAWGFADTSLVVWFDAGGVVERFSLIALR